MSEEVEMIEDGRTAHAATQTFGLVLLTVTVAVLIVVSLILFGGEDVVAFVVPFALLAGAAWATLRHDRQWARIFGIVATVVAFMGFFLAFGVFQPFSPIEFIVGLTYVLGVVFSLVGGIRALRASRAGRSEPVGAHTRTQRFVLAGIGVLAVVSLVGFMATRETVSEEDAAGAIVLDMVDFEFDPEMVSVPAGGKLLIKNADPFVHDFKFEELGLKLVVGPGSEKLVDLAELEPGVYDYFCSLHSDGTTGMAGSFSIDG